MLTSGRIRGAGLDVYEGEPLTGRPNQEIVELAKLPNVIATPHMGYNTYETAGRLGSEVVENIEACLAGHPVHVV